MSQNDRAPRSLADDLRGRSDEELAALLRERPDLLVPVPVDMAQLAARATTRASAARAVDRLDRFTFQVVEALAVVPPPVSETALEKALGVGSPFVENALAKLRGRALVWGQPDDLRLALVAHDILGPHPAGLGPPAAQALRALQPGRLAAIVADLGLPPRGDHHANAEAVAALLADDEAFQALVAELSKDALAALRALSAGPPAGRVENAAREVGRASARSAIDELLAVGLLVPVDDRTVVLPREVAVRLRGGLIHTEVQAVQPDIAIVKRDPGAVDRTAGAGALDIVRKVELLLEAWSDEPPAVLRAGGLGVRDLRRLPGLLDVDEAGAALISEVAHAAGLVGMSDDDPPGWLPTPEYDEWRRADPAVRWARLATSWITTSRAPGLVGSRDERGRTIAPLGPDLDWPLAAELRRLVLGVLADVPAGGAPDLLGVLAAAQWRRPRWSGRRRDDFVRWTLREAETLGVTGMGALARFVRPLLEGLSHDKAAQAAADAVRACLPQPLDHVLLQADLTAVAPGPLRPDLERELALLTEIESRGGASVHRFTAASLRRAFDAGRSAAEVHEFLAAISRTPVPQPLTYLVDDVARTHGRLRVGSASSFVRCDDPAVLAAILADSQAAVLGARKLAPTVLASPLRPDVVLDQLRQLGYGAAAEGPDGALIVGRRAPRRARPALVRPRRAELPAPEERLLGAAVRALRAGDRAQPDGSANGRPARLRPTEAAQTMAELRRALETGATVWIGYVDNHGTTTERLVDPAGLDGGRLSAFDHRSGEVRTFAVHRISGVAQAEPE